MLCLGGKPTGDVVRGLDDLAARHGSHERKSNQLDDPTDRAITTSTPATGNVAMAMIKGRIRPVRQNSVARAPDTQTIMPAASQIARVKLATIATPPATAISDGNNVRRDLIPSSSCQTDSFPMNPPSLVSGRVAVFEIDDGFRDGNRVVADPLEVSRSVHESEPFAHTLGLLADRVFEVRAKRSVNVINGAVTIDQRVSLLTVGVLEQVDTLLHLLEDPGSEIVQPRILRGASLLLGTLGDPGGEIADPFKLGVHSQRCRDAAQVDGHRFVKGEHAETGLLKADLAPVDFVLGRLGFGRELDRIRCIVGEGTNACVDRPARERRQLEQLVP